MSFNAIGVNKILAKISESKVNRILWKKKCVITNSCADPDNFVKRGPTQIDNIFFLS